MSASAVGRALHTLAEGQSLSEVETAAAFDEIMRGDATPVQVGAVLMGLRVKGETAAEVAGAARALRAAMVALPAANADELVDTCGTGGGRLATFNISTAAALVAAGAGVRIAKHGNRSFTTLCGSADVLEALGVRIEMPVADMQRTLERAGIVFMFAPRMHPAIRHVAPVRSELGIGTLMNMIGPLANPASAGRQVVGVSDPARLPLMAGALAALGARHALVVYGEPGMDEISPLGCTRVLEVRGGEISEWTIEPAAVGFAPGAASDLAGGPPADNARTVVEVLRGRRGGAARTAVLLNAAGAIYVSGRADSFASALDVAANALDQGKGIEALDRLRAAGQPGDAP